MNNIDKFKILSGITDFSFFKEFPNINCYKYYKKYLQDIDNYIKSTSYSQYKTRKLNFRFINRFDVNGIAYVKNGEDFIKINEGSLYVIYGMFGDLIINGAFSKYTSIKEVADSRIYLNNEGITEHEFNFKIPNDYNAKLLSEYLSMFAVKFIILHELGHHINGHLLYLEKYYGINEWYTKQTNRNIPDLLIKTLEMDADAFAISQLVREFKEMVINDKKINALNIPNEVKLGLLIFSLHNLFILLGEGFETQNYSNKYMSIKSRYLHNISCLKTNLEIQYFEFIDNINFIDVTSYYLKMSETLYFKVFKINNQLIDDLEQIIEEYNDFDEIKNTWNLIFDDLTKFARVPLSSKYKT